MSIDAGAFAQMTYNNTNNHGFSPNGLGAPGSGFGGRSRLNSKRLSVALPSNVGSIDGDHVENPTPRTSRSHLLAGLRTQPKTHAVPASAPYNHTEHYTNGVAASMWHDQGYGNGYNHAVPQTATGSSFDMSGQHSVNAGRQMYSLPEQVLAPPSMYDQSDEMDPAVLQQMQMTSLYLAQRQQQLQQQLASLTSNTQGLSLNTNLQRSAFQNVPMNLQSAQGFYGQPQVQAPMEVPGQPGVYLVYNPAMQGYSYVVDPNVQQQAQTSMSPQQQNQASAFSPSRYDAPTPSLSLTPPANERSTPNNSRSFTPPKKTSSPSSVEHVQPLPPPSATAFRRGHNKSSSLVINPSAGASDGPMTSSAAIFGSQRSAFPPAPLTGTFGPGAARAGEHPMRQPRGPPPLEELTSAPTSKHDGSKNFATRQRRRALDNLMKAGIGRRGVSRSSDNSPVSEGEYNFAISEEGEDVASVDSAGSRKMSPIGSEMKEKRSSQHSSDGYFGLSSASSSEGEDAGAYKQPPTPATPTASAQGGDRKRMLGVLSAAEKRRSFVV